MRKINGRVYKRRDETGRKTQASSSKSVKEYKLVNPGVQGIDKYALSFSIPSVH
jgi:hypothetical protein